MVFIPFFCEYCNQIIIVIPLNYAPMNTTFNWGAEHSVSRGGKDRLGKKSPFNSLLESASKSNPKSTSETCFSKFIFNLFQYYFQIFLKSFFLESFSSLFSSFLQADFHGYYPVFFHAYFLVAETMFSLRFPHTAWSGDFKIRTAAAM